MIRILRISIILTEESAEARFNDDISFSKHCHFQYLSANLMMGLKIFGLALLYKKKSWNIRLLVPIVRIKIRVDNFTIFKDSPSITTTLLGNCSPP
jgi:hypothetical protein